MYHCRIKTQRLFGSQLDERVLIIDAHGWLPAKTTTATSQTKPTALGRELKLLKTRIVVLGRGKLSASFHKHHHSWSFSRESNPCHVTHKWCQPSPFLSSASTREALFCRCQGVKWVSVIALLAAFTLNERQCPMVVKEKISVTLSISIKAQ